MRPPPPPETFDPQKLACPPLAWMEAAPAPLIVAAVIQMLPPEPAPVYPPVASAPSAATVPASVNVPPTVRWRAPRPRLPEVEVAMPPRLLRSVGCVNEPCVQPAR